MPLSSLTFHQINAFMGWMKNHVKQGHSVSFGLYNAQYWYVPNTPSEQATYDHIVSLYSISSYYPGDEYHSDDRLTFR